MTTNQPSPRFLVAQLDEVPPQPCPCGTTRRAFTEDPEQLASAHLLEIDGAARTHYHRRTTEVYVFLEGEGEMELDGERIPVRPFTSVLIKPGCRHRAVGRFRLINVPIPAFDPEDEWFDE
ncbi:MAG: cupin domain-containing protein [Armatimonadota bacterium]